MAIDFLGSTSGIRGTSAPFVAAYPYTIACRFRLQNYSDSVAHVLSGYFKVGAGVDVGAYLAVDNRSANGVVQKVTFVRTTANNWDSISTSTQVADNLWHNAIATQTAANAGSVWLDNAGVGTGTVSRDIVSSAPDIAAIGHYVANGSASSDNNDHEVAECAMWSVALDADEREAFNKGISPLLIRPASLVFYAPAIRNVIDLKGLALTNTNTAVADHPRVYYPAFGRSRKTAAAAGGTQTLTPSLFTNAQTFFAPTVSATYSLTPALYTNTQTFFAATVAPGAVTLTPALFTNAQTFFGPTVSQGDVLSPSLVTNTQTFYSPTVAAGAVTLQPSLVANTNTFFGATVSGGASSSSAGGGWIDPRALERLERLRRDAERTRQTAWEKRQERDAKRLAELHSIYDRIQGNATEEEAAELAGTVAEFATVDAPASSNALPQVDWAALLTTARAVAEVAATLQRIMSERNQASALARDQADLDDLAFLASAA